MRLTDIPRGKQLARDFFPSTFHKSMLDKLETDLTAEERAETLILAGISLGLLTTPTFPSGDYNSQTDAEYVAGLEKVRDLYKEAYELLVHDNLDLNPVMALDSYRLFQSARVDALIAHYVCEARKIFEDLKADSADTLMSQSTFGDPGAILSYTESFLRCSATLKAGYAAILYIAGVDESWPKDKTSVTAGLDEFALILDQVETITESVEPLSEDQKGQVSSSKAMIERFQKLARLTEDCTQ